MRWKKPPKGEIYTSVLPTVDDDEDKLAKRVIDYADTPPGTFIISGPLPGGGGPGRPMDSASAAWEWALEFYGPENVLYPIKRAHPGGRWAIRVRPKSNDQPVVGLGEGADAEVS